MKKIILSFGFGLIATLAFSQRIEVQHTFKVDKAVEISTPTQAEFLKDNSLGLGVVRVVLLIEHNTTDKAYNDILRNRIKSVTTADNIGLEMDSRQILGRNGFELKEEVKSLVFMSADTARKLK